MKYPTFCKNQIQSTFLLVSLLALFATQLTVTIVASYFFSALVVLLRPGALQVSRRNFEFMLLGIFCCFVPVVTLNHGVTPLFYLAMTPLLLWMAAQFSNNPLTVIRSALRNTYWIFLIFIFIGLIVHWGEPEPLGAILPWTSTNGFPSYLIVLQIAYSLSYFLEFKRLPLTSCFITLIVAVIGLGRGSMIVGTLIFSSSLIFNITLLKSTRDRWWAFRLFLIFVGPAFFFYIYNMDSINLTFELWFQESKFAGGVLDEHRGRMLADYLAKLANPLWLLLGTSYQYTSINDFYGGNPHNSYIRVHSFYGLLGLVIIFIPFLVLIISRKIFIQKIVFASFIFFALLRATSEPLFFPSALDFFYFLYFLLFFKYSESRN